MRRVVLYKGEDGYWIAECPTLPVCVSQGKTVEEALENVREAITAYVEALELDHLPVPSETEGLLGQEAIDAIEAARSRIKAGHFVTEEEAKKRLGL